MCAELDSDVCKAAMVEDELCEAAVTEGEVRDDDGNAAKWPEQHRAYKEQQGILEVKTFPLMNLTPRLQDAVNIKVTEYLMKGGKLSDPWVLDINQRIDRMPKAGQTLVWGVCCKCGEPITKEGVCVDIFCLGWVVGRLRKPHPPITKTIAGPKQDQTLVWDACGRHGKSITKDGVFF